MQSTSRIEPVRTTAVRWAPWLPYLFSMPALILVGGLFLFPVIRMVVTSFIARSDAGAGFSVARYVTVLTDPYYLKMLWRTVYLSGVTTVVTLVAAYPVALFMRQVSSKWRSYLSLILLSPLLMSVVVRTLGWVILLAPRGVVNTTLQALGLPVVKLIYNDQAVVMGLTHVYFGYMVLSLMTSILRIDDNLLMAASSLGASRWQVFRQVTWPLSLPGVLAGCILVFTLSASAYVTPALLGGNATKLMAMRVYELAIVYLEWEEAAVFATILFAVIFLAVWLLTRVMESGKRRVIFR